MEEKNQYVNDELMKAGAQEAFNYQIDNELMMVVDVQVVQQSWNETDNALMKADAVHRLQMLWHPVLHVRMMSVLLSYELTRK